MKFRSTRADVCLPYDETAAAVKHMLRPRLPGWKQIRKPRATAWLGFRKTFLFVTGILRPLKIRSKTNSSQCWIATSSWIVGLARFLWLKLMPCLAKTVIRAIGTIWEEPEQPGFPDSWVPLNFVSAFICLPQEWNEMQAKYKDLTTTLDPVMCKIRKQDDKNNTIKKKLQESS